MTPIEDNDTAYSVKGSGPTVVLIHGLGLNQEMWNFQISEMIPSFEVLSYDLLGHGKSTKVFDNYCLNSFVDQLDELLNKREVKNCALVGFSLGGLIARAYAVKYPDRIHALVILNSPHDRTDKQREAVRKRVKQVEIYGAEATVEDAINRWFTEGFLKENVKLSNRIRDWVLSNEKTTYARLYHVLAEGDIELITSIKAIRCPTMIVACAKDYGNSPLMAEQMAGLIPDSEIRIIPELRHLGLMENPTVFNNAFVPFLQKLLCKKIT